MTPLARTFFARFFENDVTGGSGDLRSSFFWLIAFLAVPGTVIPILMSFNWDGFAIGQGTEFLRVASRADKVLYLGFAMISSGFLAAVTWSSLLLDRRDCLILGTLPVAGPQIVRAKITALCTCIALVTMCTHALPAVSYGFFLGTHNTLAFAGRGIVAHFVASCSASAFVLFAVAAVQGLLLAVVGPRRFASISPWLQSVVVAVVLAGLVLLPIISASTVGTVGGLPHPVRALRFWNPAGHPWILWTPPLWFLGIYEVVLGTADAGLIRLGIVAAAASIGAALLTFVTYPIAYRRLVAAVVEMPEPSARHGWAGRLVQLAVSTVSRNSVTRASSQFFLTAIRRSARHRLTVAVAIGVAIALVSPTLFRWAPQLTALPETPILDLLALPLEIILLLLVGLRIAAALPADLGSGWLLDCIGAPAALMRSGLWRTMFVAAVVPVSLITALTYRNAWGDRVALMHAALCLVVGAVLIEMLLWGLDAMPCSRPWRPEHANVRKWWPAYLALLGVIVSGLPWVERMCFEEHTGFSALIGILMAVGIVLRVTHRRRRIIPEEGLDDPVQVQVLNLD